MGLDMTLERRTYVRNWSHMTEAQRTTVIVERGGVPLASIEPERITHIVEEVAYWRKENAVHKWFVDNCQGGEDDCRQAYVRVEQIQELVDTCKRLVAELKLVEGKISSGFQFKDGKQVEVFTEGLVVANSELAHELLPTQGGFFFGGVGYDEWYVNGLKETIEMLEPLLVDTHGEFYYQSSW